MSLVSSEKISGNGADWSSWSKKVSPEATFRCGLAMRHSKSFRLCKNTKTKDSSPALIPSRIGELQNSQILPFPILSFRAAANVAQRTSEELQGQSTSRGHHRPTFGKKVHLPFPYKGLRLRNMKM